MLKIQALISLKSEWIQWSINISVISVSTFYGLEYYENLINLLSKWLPQCYVKSCFANENRAVIMISICCKRSSIQLLSTTLGVLHAILRQRSLSPSCNKGQINLLSRVLWHTKVNPVIFQRWLPGHNRNRGNIRPGPLDRRDLWQLHVWPGYLTCRLSVNSYI